MGAVVRKIRTIEELDEILAESLVRPVWILKHSLVCPLSSEGRREFERFVAADRGEALFTLIEVQRARDVSDELARRLGVRHETPQALLVVDGEAKWHGSHWTITTAALAEAVRNERAAAGVKSG